MLSSGPDAHALPRTQITITSLEEGWRAGDWVFSAATISRLPEWRADVDGLTVSDGVQVRNWVQEQADFTGHLVPRRFVDALSEEFQSDVWDHRCGSSPPT